MNLANLTGFSQFIDDMLRSPQIWISPSQVDNVFARPPGFHFDFIHRCEYVRRQSIQPGKRKHNLLLKLCFQSRKVILLMQPQPKKDNFICEVELDFQKFFDFYAG
jgi:hypothetical protein